ncbi:glycosyl hydrolases family 18-domain-containing protein, partial [Mycena sanguinolenta]
EYPSAIERAAPATDTPNLTAFFQELRTALPTQVISCATPAGYWFLQGFEIDKIASSVTYLNMIRQHGPWDTNVTDQAPVTNPHTSILDMQASASLYIRAGIKLNVAMVKLKRWAGLAYYGRTYQLADAACVGYNCTMTGGGFPGDCTFTPGILAQFEIETILNGGIAPTLDKPTETYWFDDSVLRQGSLITFDQQDTWAAKTLFAETTCFGGTFIWSLDQVITNPGDGGGNLGSGPGSGSGQGTYVSVEWNPNPFPSPNAASETFVQIPGSATTIVVPVPKATTTVIVEGATITLNSGGTPVNAPVPTGILQPSAITPTFTQNISPTQNATVIVYTAPLTSPVTWSSTVTIPPKSTSPPVAVTGPPGDHSRCGSVVS